MLISFEGIDGCGKSTQIELFKKYLDEKKIQYSVFREPGGTSLSENIRNLLLHEAKEMNPVTELLLFSAARSQLISEKVVPLLEKGEVVILDRFFDSTTAYQGYGRQSADLESIHSLNQLAAHGLTPDLTFYLVVDVNEAERRTYGGKKDRMESEGADFFRKVRDGYEEIARNEERFVQVDAMKSPELVHQQIILLYEAYR